MGSLVLVTGGARSGKSGYALQLAANTDGSVLFVATGVATDDEMAARIARHQSERPTDWATLETRYDVGAELESSWQGQTCVLIEDLATLVSNLLLERSADERAVLAEVEGLLDFRASRGVDLIVVTQEVGWGVVPPSPLGRAFRDLIGTANQRLAQQADQVVLLVTGLPLRLKG
jgi:adenosylcobinamide kinase/adenosylcobinamide-phosphate guanylyltransferase